MKLTVGIPDGIDLDEESPVWAEVTGAGVSLHVVPWQLDASGAMPAPVELRMSAESARLVAANLCAAADAYDDDFRKVGS